jgi:D-alanyl-lipoteichoic acid acyltransferase DltB (MBOAT superfamily)
MLRIDSLEFVVISAALVLLLRLLPTRGARAAYALVSAAVYLALAPNPASIVLSLLFVYWPWLWLRSTPAGTGPRAIPWLFAIQTAALLWARKYFALLPFAAASPLLSHAIALIGVSYIILRQVELVLWIDANPDVRVGLLEYTAFTIGLFTLLAGPIIPYATFRQSFSFDRSGESPRSLALAGNRIVNGYIKVALLSPVLFELSSLQTLRSLESSLGGRLLFFYLFPLYVYLNFAGYCDVVIGLGRLAGFEIPENFDRPYLATNLQNYWQRWHLTFSHWIRNHIFFPLVRALRGSDNAALRRVGMPLAVLATFVLVGIWHGTDPGFALFGLLHGLAVLAVTPYTRLLDRYLSPTARAFYDESRVMRLLRMTACYHYLCFTMIFFERPLAQVRALWS